MTNRMKEIDDFVAKMQQRLDSDGLTLIGIGPEGTRYYRNDCAEDNGLERNYVYQQHAPDRDVFVNGTNKRGKYAGWLCSLDAWDRFFSKNKTLPQGENL